MSTRTDWGIFASDGTPLAVGDDHWRWQCPKQESRRVQPYEHFITGEMIDPGDWELVPCPWLSAGVKLDRCTKCGAEFRYP